MPIWQQPHQPSPPNWVGSRVASTLPPVSTMAAFAVMVASINQLILPVSDTSNSGTWVQDDGVTTSNLYTRVFEQPASDIDFIESPTQPSFSKYVTRMGAVQQPVAGAITIHTRASVDISQGVVDYIVSLNQGATTIQSFAHNGISTTWIQFDDIITNTITDWSTPFDVQVQMNKSR